MKIELNNITVRELVEGYSDDGDGGVVGFAGKLDIRPSFQREFVYKDTQRDAVIETILAGFPLNVMYWAVRDDGTFEIIDGQQRTISIGQYVTGMFSFDKLYFGNLQDDQRETILNYELMVYTCEGTDSEKLKWFETINIAGEKLYPQELRNAVYAGIWVSDAKRYFSRPGCPAYGIAKDYVKGELNRHTYLETAIKWINDGKIEDYMAEHQNEPSAVDLWNYFQSVINWVEAVFKEKRKEMNGLPWGDLYNQHKDKKLDPDEVEREVAELMMDEEIQKKSGIYTYVLTREERHLNLRKFNDTQKREAYERQKGICLACNEHKEFSEMEGDHIDPWIQGGKTEADNCQMLCMSCNRRKSDK